MHALMDELRNGLMVDWAQLVRIAVRLLLSAGLGAVVGLQREQTGKPAGLRTHMLVALGATLFVLAPLEMDVSMSDIGRVIQGVATGIGFIGGGAILKLSAEREVRGLTSAAGIWITAAAGVAVGLGRLAIAAVSILLTWIILAIIGRAERRIEKNRGL
ncbi:MAG TPA: MgtC/SapB family protein [Candidatus Eisenbacteria bacterium]|jgi:putative Mg2+ transporter-C (MgtC) family protein|nr:MgtC/SapB family protein [Candidatus Eisenbacteria bacterium]